MHSHTGKVFAASFHMLSSFLQGLQLRIHSHVWFDISFYVTTLCIFFMLGDKEGGQGAPPRGCILGAAWLGIEPRTASLKVDILTEGHSGTKVMPTLHVVLIFLTFFLKQKRKQNL